MIKNILVVIIILLSTSILCADTTPTYQQRQTELRKQGEAEIQRRHELALASIKAEILASRLQLAAGDVNVYNNSYAEANVENEISNRQTVTQTNENNN